MDLSRRDMVKMTAGAGAYLALSGCRMSEVTSGLVTKPILSSGEQIPVIGIGTARDRFVLDQPPEDIAMRKQVFQEFTAMGGRMLDVYIGEDTETLCGNLIQELGSVLQTRHGEDDCRCRCLPCAQWLRHVRRHFGAGHQAHSVLGRTDTSHWHRNRLEADKLVDAAIPALELQAARLAMEVLDVERSEISFADALT